MWYVISQLLLRNKSKVIMILLATGIILGSCYETPPFVINRTFKMVNFSKITKEKIAVYDGKDYEFFTNGDYSIKNNVIYYKDYDIMFMSWFVCFLLIIYVIQSTISDDSDNNWEYKRIIINKTKRNLILEIVDNKYLFIDPKKNRLVYTTDSAFDRANDYTIEHYINRTEEYPLYYTKQLKRGTTIKDILN